MALNWAGAHGRGELDRACYGDWMEYQQPDPEYPMHTSAFSSLRQKENFRKNICGELECSAQMVDETNRQKITEERGGK